MWLKASVRALLAVVLVLFIVMAQGCDKKMLIIYFTDSDNDFAGEALDRMNYAYTRAYSFADFSLKFASGEWDLVVFDNRHPELQPIIEAALQEIYIFQMQGGKVLISSCYLGEEDYGIFWADFGYQWKSSSIFPANVYRINPADELWTEPNDVADLNLIGATDAYGNAVNAFKGASILGGTKVATFNGANPTDPNAGAVFKSNSGRTLLNAFYLDDAIIGGVPIDFDDDGIADAVEWYMNELAALERVAGNRVDMRDDD